MSHQRRILVTSALPYANGSIHIGHLVEYIYTDIWVRYLRMSGAEARYFCADDTHGTPIQIRAMQEGRSPESLIEQYREEHQRDFRDFQIEFDCFHSTHSEENRRWAGRIYQAAVDKGHIARKVVEQTYCAHDKMFLPDRFVRGTCPKCGAEDQYGDSCEVCGATYAPTDLGSPRCAVCGNPPERRNSEHLFFELHKLSAELDAWTGQPGHLQAEVANYVRRWIEGGLRDWDISRDGPYFGFPIPGEDNLFFYVWMDAPIGYIATTQKWCDDHGRDVAEFWEDRDTRIYHFIGKDIVYFHCLFWPAMLMDAELNLPTSVVVHGFLTVEGKKMSKSRGTLVAARTFLDHLPADYLRYYYGTRLNGRVEDIDLSFDDFTNRVNAELVNKISNLASRALSFVEKRLERRLGTLPDDAHALMAARGEAWTRAAEAYERRDVAAALDEAVALAERGNLYLQETAPWAAMKDDPERARSICTAAVNVVLTVGVILRPVLPVIADRLAHMMNLPPFDWAVGAATLERHEIGVFEHLIGRMEREKLLAMIDASKPQTSEPGEGEPLAADYEVAPLAPTCTFEDFAKVDVRVARIHSAREVPKADKLLALELDLGPLGMRNVFAGIRAAFPDPSALVGRHVACVANLAPRKMRFGVSEGMVLAAGEGRRIHLLDTGPDSRPGERVS
jgi:methionyl-tRNA synthetase